MGCVEQTEVERFERELAALGILGAAEIGAIVRGNLRAAMGKAVSGYVGGRRRIGIDRHESIEIAGIPPRRAVGHRRHHRLFRGGDGGLRYGRRRKDHCHRYNTDRSYHLPLSSVSTSAASASLDRASAHRKPW